MTRTRGWLLLEASAGTSALAAILTVREQGGLLLNAAAIVIAAAAIAFTVMCDIYRRRANPAA